MGLDAGAVGNDCPALGGVVPGAKCTCSAVQQGVALEFHKAHLAARLQAGAVRGAVIVKVVAGLSAVVWDRWSVALAV